MTRTISLSEARRVLPSIVDAVSKDGARVDITRRGVAVASIVRTSDLPDRGAETTPPGDLRVEFDFDPTELVQVVRELRARVGHARSQRAQAPKSRATRSRK